MITGHFEGVFLLVTFPLLCLVTMKGNHKMPSESSNPTFRDLIESILKQGLNQSSSCFVSEQTLPSPVPSAKPEPSVHTEINPKVIEQFLKP